jgi:hypothetical protein
MLTNSRSTFPEGPSWIENIQEMRGLAEAEHWHHLSHIFSNLKLDKFNQRNSSPKAIQTFKAKREWPLVYKFLTDDSGTELFKRPGITRKSEDETGDKRARTCCPVYQDGPQKAVLRIRIRDPVPF